MPRSRHILHAALLLGILCPLIRGSACLAATDLSERVLVLHSYHAGFTWTDEIQWGIISEFRRQDPHWEPFVEYLDWKRFPTREHLRDAAESLKRKYARQRFDVVIVSDNAALDFALKYRDSIFPGASIVFCGINGYSDSMLAGQERVTGVVEDIDAEGTIQAALAVLPATRKVLALVENSESGQAQKADVVKAARKFEGRLELVFLDNPSLEEVYAACNKEADKDTILLLCSFARDRTGRIFPDFAVDLLSTGCKTPVFVMWDFLLGKGAVGGSVLSGKLQGREAARIALSLLAGKTDLPVESNPPTQVMFDREQLGRFGISPGSLPKGSLLINEPVTLFQRYRKLLPAILITMGLMAAAIASLSVNILARRRVERELEKTKALLAAAIEYSPVGIMVVEAPRLVLSLANPAAQRILGQAHDPANHANFLSDMTWKCLRPDGTAYEPSELALPKAVRQGLTTDNIEARIIRADGEERWIMLSTSPIRERSGDILAGIAVFADITARKRMEDMVIQSEKMMSLGGLAAGMAHEINNPLGIIVHAAQNALRRVSPELEVNRNAAREAGTSLETVRAYLESRHIVTYIQDIIDAGHRASRIVRSMLSFSRPKQSERTPLKVGPLLDKAVELARSDYDIKRNYDIKKVRFLRYYSQPDPSGLFAETEIVQVFLNIIKNAAQAMSSKIYPAGVEPTVLLRTGVNNGEIVVEIEDNGPGMDERLRKRVMEPFFTTKQVGEGTGLGLSVSYFIVTNSYGGSLRVRSEPGKGTAFTIRLPRGRAGNSA